MAKQIPPRVAAIEGTYKGGPTISFREGEDDRFPFTFGPAKARKLLHFLEDQGAEVMMKTLRDLVAKGEE